MPTLRQIAALLLALLVPIGSATAQELEPRAYRSLPTGLNFLVIGYGSSTGNVLFDTSIPIEDLRAEVDTTTVAYLRSLSILGRSASIRAAVPFVSASASGRFEGEFLGGSRSALADARFQVAVNLLGAPALPPDDFARYRQRRNIGVSLTVAAPTGQYDSDRIINFGSNRWSFKPEIGYSSRRGRWTFETALGVWLFTDNNDFVGATREQDPIGSLQFHLSYDFKPGLWLGLASNYYTGGRTTVADAKRGDLQKNSRIGLTLSLPVAKAQSIQLQAHTGAFTRVGADFDTAAVAYQLRW